MKPSTCSFQRVLCAVGATFFAWFLPFSPGGARAEAPRGGSIRFLKAWGGQGSGPGQFNVPVGIAINRADEVFVADHYNDRVQKFTSDGKLLAQFPVLASPGGIALDPAGRFYLTHFAASLAEKDKAKECLSVYGRDGKLLRQWGKHGPADGDFDCPGGLAFGKDGRLYVADQTNHRIQVFTPEGKLLLKWGEYGSAPGQFGGKENRLARTGGPQFVTLDAAGNVWTSEAMNDRIQEFSPEGKFIRAWGDPSDKPGGLGGLFRWTDGRPGRLHGPIGLCFDARGRLWIAAASGRVQAFTPDGNYLMGIGDEPGAGPGQFNVPHGVAFDSKGRLYVADSINHRIQKFEIIPEDR